MRNSPLKNGEWSDQQRFLHSKHLTFIKSPHAQHENTLKDNISTMLWKVSHSANTPLTLLTGTYSTTKRMFVLLNFYNNSFHSSLGLLNWSIIPLLTLSFPITYLSDCFGAWHRQTKASMIALKCWMENYLELHPV